MSIFGRTFDVLGVKAEAAARTAVTSEPRLGQSDYGRYSITNARTHGRAYGGGKDGVDWFYDASNVIAKTAATAPFHFENEEGTEKRYMRKRDDLPEDAQVAAFDLRELFVQPNPWMGWQEHMHLAIVDLLAVGNYFWLKWNADDDGNKPFALYRLSPALLEVVPGKGKLIDHYRYGNGRDAIEIKPQHVVHGRLPNPHSPHSVLGLGVVQAAPQVFDIELGMLQAQRSFFQKGTVLAGALESDRTIPKPTRQAAVKEFRNLNRGSSNWYNVAFLERGLRYRPIQANAQEAGYQALSKLSRDRVFALLGVPRILAGIDDGTMKLQEARRFFAEDTMQPLLGTEAPGSGIQHVMSVSLTQAWGLNFVYDYGYQMPEEDRIGLALDYADLPGVRVKELRAKAGLGPLGDDVVDEDGIRIDDYVLNMPSPSTEGPDGAADTGGTGRPPRRGNVPAFPVSPDAADRRPEDAPDGNAGRARRAQLGAIRPRSAGKSVITSDQLATMSIDDLMAVR